MAQKVTDWQAYKPQIDLYISDEQDLLQDAGLESMFTVKGTDRLQVNEVGRTGYGIMQEVGELGDAVEDAAQETYSYSFQRRVYRKSTVFSSDLLQTDQIGEIERVAKDFVRTVKYTRCLNAFGLIRNAFNTARTYGDGKPLVSTVHPLKNGNGTQVNTFRDGVQRDLSYDNALLLEDIMYSNVSNAGNLLTLGNSSNNKVLWCSPYLREKAFQIAGVNGPDGKPGTLDNDRNYFRKGARFDVMVLDFVKWEAANQAGEATGITKSSASNYWDSMWGIADLDIVKKYFRFYYANGYEKYDDEIRKANESMIKYANDKYAFGTSGWFGFTASKGDNSTYSS